MEDQSTWLDVAIYAVPVVLGPVLAKLVNENSSKWKEWTGTFGKVIGLLVALADVLRKPSAYIKDVKGK